MLSSTTTVSLQTSFNNPRQIAARADAGGVIMYTVPAGKKFQGQVYGNTVATSITVTPLGGAAITAPVPSINISYQSVSPLSLTLVAGTIIANSSGSQINLIGVETDA